MVTKIKIYGSKEKLSSVEVCNLNLQDITTRNPYGRGVKYKRT
jgi:hypothetical protein